MRTTDFTAPIAADASADAFKSAVKGVYKDKAGSSITVTLVMYDVDGLETDVAENAVDYEYTISLDKRITGQTFTNI